MPRLLTGNKTASKAERGADFYASPYAALPPLLVAEGRRLPKTIWEPSAGNGALVIPLRNRGFTVTATDLHDWGCPEATGGIDFLERVAEDFKPAGPFGIVTNPPFGIIEEYLERAAQLAPYTALLCRLAFLESEGRHLWWPRVGLRRVHIIPERLPMMHRHGYVGPKLSNAGMCFAWFIFEPGKKPLSKIPMQWVSWKAACRRYPRQEADMLPDAKDQLGLFGGLAA